MKKISLTITIIGITGDLAEKKLLPALYNLASRGHLDDDTKLYGTSRRPITNEQIIAKLHKTDGDKTAEWLKARLTTMTADLSTDEGASILAKSLSDVQGTRLFYLSIPPDSFANVITSMANAGLNGENDRLLIEKPFGRDFASAIDLQKLTADNFNEANVYRIDHYLAKPGVLSFSQSGKQILNPSKLQAIDISSDEVLDIQGRGDFYEQTGALRDVIQSHLLQVLAAVMAATPSTAPLAEKKLAALKSLKVLGAYRAQYTGYRDEVANISSAVETYAAIELSSSLHDWQNVRLTLRSGKALPEKRSNISLTFTDGTRTVFDMNANPDNILEGYEQVLYDATTGNHHLFLDTEVVNESWRVVDGLLAQWSTSENGLDAYAKNTMPTSSI